MEDLNDFDVWYSELIQELAKNSRRAPYKMAWFEYYESGYTAADAAVKGPYIEE